MKLKLLLFTFALIFILNGCNKDAAQYKDEADREVHGIIDGQWRDEFGPEHLAAADESLADVLEALGY